MAIHLPDQKGRDRCARCAELEAELAAERARPRPRVVIKSYIDEFGREFLFFQLPQKLHRTEDAAFAWAKANGFEVEESNG